jgi:hypothetical protein
MVGNVRWSGSIAMLLASLVGCTPAAPKTFPVQGIVKTTTGEPCSGALVVFHPSDEARLNAPKPFATCGADGSFRLTTYQEGDGAAQGDYAVTIVWPGEIAAGEMSLSSEGKAVGADRLRNNYGDPRSPRLKATVRSDPAQSIALEVDPSIAPPVVADP